MLQKTPQGDKLRSLTNVPNTADNIPSGKMIERQPIKGTPFIMVNPNGEGWILTFGKYKISGLHKSKTQLQKKVANKDWDILMSVLEAFETMRMEYNNALKVQTNQ